MRRRMIRMLLASAAALTLTSLPARAQLFGGIVYDPSNHAQNLLTAARTLIMINNQVKQLTHEAEMIVNQAKDLASLPYTARAALKARIDEIETLIASAKGLAYDVAAIETQFETLFPEDYGSAANAAMAADARAHWREASRAFRDAMVMQAKIVETIGADETTLDEIVAASETAIGGVQAQQAANQLLALQTKQAMQTAALAAVGARADALDRARQLQMEERARVHRDRFLGDGVVYP